MLALSSTYYQTPSHKVGIAYATDQGLSLTLIVLPKAWKPQQNKFGKIDTITHIWSKDHQVLCVYENQYVELQISCPKSEDNNKAFLDARNKLLNKLFNIIESQQADEDDDNDTDKNSDNKPLLSEIAKSVFDKKRRKIETSPPSAFFASEDAIVETPPPNQEEGVSNILKLLSLLRYAKFQTPEGVLDKPDQDDMLTPLLHYRFMQEMLQNHRNIRRNYVPRTDIIGTVKGQVDPFSAARIEESGETLVRCHYDEFEEGTILMKVLVTALDVLSAGNWLTKHHNHADANDTDLNLANGQSKAIQLRRFLHSIPSFTRRVAMQKAHRIRTNRMTAMFNQALEYAKLILENKSLLFMDEETNEDLAWCWEVDMSDVWEEILYKGLSNLEQQKYLHAMYYDKTDKNTILTNEKSHLYPPGSITGAFGVKSKSRPDLLTQISGDKPINWILDAKYSYFKDLPSSPSGTYRDQMFRYLYLMSEDMGTGSGKSWAKCRASKPWAHQMALIYTTEPLSENDVALEKPTHNSLESQGIWPWMSQDPPCKPPHLYQVALPFPNNTTNISSLKQWNLYMEQLTTLLGRFLKVQ
ncbi:MAG: hypothetical protein CL916_08745 [Deltaproteobacteria bacterium]|nr:hypothetical protein [Deltaproteobacteria bacterium]